MSASPDSHIDFELPANRAVIRDAAIHPALREVLLVALDGEIGEHRRSCAPYGDLDIEVSDDDTASAMWAEDIGALCCFTVTPGRLTFERWAPGDAENRQTETLDFRTLDSLHAMTLLDEFNAMIDIKELKAYE